MRRYSRLACLTLILSPFAVADENQTPLQACYQSSIDLVAANQCLNRKLAQAEEALSSALSSVAQERMARPEADNGREESEDILSASQRLFVQYRKAHCAWYAARVKAEASAGDLAKDCLIGMTLERAAQLRAKPQTPPMARVQAPPAAPGGNTQQWHGFEWKLVKLTHDGEQIALADASKITATFYTGGRVAGMASVNRYFGSYKVDAEDRITWTTPAFGATRVAGPSHLIRQEQLFLDSLGRATRVRMDGTDLVLDSDDHKVILTFAK